MFVVNNGVMPFEQVAPWLVPQLMWHILCLGPSCKSAVFCSHTATQGCAILRLPRDDDYISQLLYFVGVFHERYAREGWDLHPDFFLNPPPPVRTTRDHGHVRRSSSASSAASASLLHVEKEAYDALLKATLRLSVTAKVVARIPNEQIQRHPWSSPSFFLQPKQSSS